MRPQLMGSPEKIQALQALPAVLEPLRGAGRRIVLCHGVFDLLHVGHIRHLQRARAEGDVLVVTVTPDRWVNKGPSRPAFGHDLRLEALAALDCIDYVALNEWPTAVETIALLRPDVYVKGGEYRDEERDVTGGIRREREAVEAVGGRMAFTDELTFSSSRLINAHMPALPEEARAWLAAFRERHDADRVLAALDAARDLDVLVVGETIIDEYQYCAAIGKSSKAPAVVARTEALERFAGGILAVANNLADFCGRVTVLTQLGALSSHEGFVRAQLDSRIEPVLVERRDAPTIVKRRFIESYFFTTMFELYEINDESLHPDDDNRICDALLERCRRADLVLVVDYGHSMLSANAVDVLCGESRFLAMNAQANAGNRGYHRISKYRRADYVCAAEHELYLEARDWRGDLQPILVDVAERLACPRVVVTCGKRGALAYGGDEGFVETPSLAAKVVDRVGAGDAFLAATAPLAATGAPLDLTSFVGNVAGAEAVATVGHRRYMQRESFARHIQVLLR